jgi:tRNA(fMet)-specific endonuclease VapC
MKCLDTNAVIAVINNRPLAARVWLMGELASGAAIGLPVVVLFEMIYGCEKSDRRSENEAALKAFLTLGVELWPFEAADAEHAGNIRAYLESAGTPIGSYDYLIAAQARCRGATLVTANRREFERVPGLMVSDWT